MTRIWLVTGALLAATTVGLGAYGAHGLEKLIAGAVADVPKNLGYWETANRYQMYHCLAIVAVGMASSMYQRNRLFDVAGVLFLLGIVLFSGMLYTLAVTDLKILGAIVPLGGLSLIVGWVVFAVGLFRVTARQVSE